MMSIGQMLADQIDVTRQWTLALLEDFRGDEWTFQPQPGLHHALWLCGHLATSQETLVFKRCFGREPVLDPAFREHFGMGGPVRSAQEHAYPPPAEVLATMADVHAQVCAMIRTASDAALSEAAYAADGKSRHPYYDTRAGALGHASRHEAFHAGQIALLRRLLGKNFLR